MQKIETSVKLISPLFAFLITMFFFIIFLKLTKIFYKSHL